MIAAGGGSPTPPEPVFVDYIETDGTAYIDTGIKGNAPMSTKLQFVPKLLQSGSSYVFGCRKDSGDTRFAFVAVNQDKKVFYAYASAVLQGIDVSASVDNGTFAIVQTRFKAGQQIIYKKEEGESSYTTSQGSLTSNIQTNSNIYVFCQNDRGTPSAIPLGLRLKYCQIFSDYDWTNLVFDGIPVYYNGQYGLWDRVTDTFFGNAAASGAFTGPSIQ